MPAPLFWKSASSMETPSAHLCVWCMVTAEQVFIMEYINYSVKIYFIFSMVTCENGDGNGHISLDITAL